MFQRFQLHVIAGYNIRNIFFFCDARDFLIQFLGFILHIGNIF